MRLNVYFLNGLMTGILLSILTVNSFAQTIEDELLNIKIGSNVQELNKKYGGLYKHSLAMGEVLHEACNQNNLEVFTFVEEPWSLGRITNIEVRKESDVSICRDSQGSLPDLAIKPITPKGIKLGDEEQKILNKYGPPNEVHQVEGDRFLKYKLNILKQNSLVSKGVLVFEIINNHVASFSLEGDILGVVKPQ